MKDKNENIVEEENKQQARTKATMLADAMGQQADLSKQLAGVKAASFTAAGAGTSEYVYCPGMDVDSEKSSQLLRARRDLCHAPLLPRGVCIHLEVYYTKSETGTELARHSSENTL